MNRTLAGYVTAALVDVLNGAMVLTLPYVALVLGAGALGTVANLAAAVTYASVCAAGSRWRPFDDRVTALVVGASAFAAALGLLGAFPTVATLFAAAVLAGGGLGLFFPALQAWFTEGLGEQRLVQAMGGYVICWVAGFMLGPWLAGHVLNVDLADLPRLGQRVSWLLQGGAVLAALVAVFFRFAAFAPPGEAGGVVGAGPAPARDAPHQADLATRRIFLTLMWLTTFSASFVIALVRYLFTEMAKEEHLAPALVGSVNAIMYVALIALVLVMRRWRFWLFRLRYVLLFQALALPAVAGFVLTKSVAVYVAGALLIGAAHGFAVFAAPAYALMVEHDKDRNISLYESLVGVGSLASGAVGVTVASWFGAKASFVPGAVVLLATMALQIGLFTAWRARSGRSGLDNQADES